ncbi:reverse transcriptase domain-containing protein [Tanacetum coccineum]
MTGIPRFVAEHELKIYPHIEPRVQRKRSIAPDKRNVVKEEVEEWLKSRIVKRVRLKNVVATYQRLVDTIFEGQIRMNLEAYVDDMVIKSKTESDLIKDIEETLLTLKKVNMKLNPKKCSFRMEEGKFLGLSGKLAALNRRGIPENAKADSKDTNVNSPYEGRGADGIAARGGGELCSDGKASSSITGKRQEDFLDDTIAGDDPTSKGTTETKKILEPDEDLKLSRNKEEQTAVGLIDDTDTWKMYIYGASNDHGSGAGLILIDPEGMEYSYTLSNSNNDAEYEALLA